MKYLQSNPGIASGELTIKGTRIRIAQVISMLANGITLEDMASDWWPWLSSDTLRGAVDEAIKEFETKRATSQTHA